MIWILLIFAVVVLAYYLALRSMSDYRDLPPKKEDYGLFLIKNGSEFNATFFQKLYSRYKDEITSFERLYKGVNHALVWYCPRKVAKDFEELSLLEIEDYTEKIPEHHIQGWELVFKKKREEHASYHFFSDLPRAEDEQVCFQIVCTGDKKPGNFQSTLRILVSGEDSLKRAHVSKEIDERISHGSNFKRSTKKHTSLQVSKFYKLRSMYPRQVEKQTLFGTDLLALIRQ